MARGQTLESILNLVRAEARLSLSPALNAQRIDSHKILIQREQERLWEDYAWPHMRVHHLIALQDGQYLYDLPTADYDGAGNYTLTADRVESISVMDGGEWAPLCPEITEANYNVHQTVLDDRAWPVRAWRIDENDQIEVWPIPDTDGDADTYEGYLRVTGIRSTRPFVAESDRADLDDRLLALYVAGMVAIDDSTKKLALEAANKLYTKLKGKQTKTKSFQLFGTETPKPKFRRPRPYISRYVR